MRQTTPREKTLLHTPQRSEAARVEIIRAGVAVDITDRVTSGSISFSANNRVAVADITIEDMFPVFGAANSLSPLQINSAFNNPTPLLWSGNELKIYFGVNTLLSNVVQYKLVFHGVLGDNIRPSSSPNSRAISLSCRDLAKRLQDDFIRGELIYGSEEGEPVVAVLQSVLNDRFSWDKNAPNYKKLHVKAAMDGNNNLTGSPFVVTTMKVGNVSCWDALNQIIGCTAGDDMGFELRYTFLPAGDNSTRDNEGNVITVAADGFYLTLLPIEQATTIPVDAITTGFDEIQEHSVGISDDTIRNSIYGTYVDRFTHAPMELHREDLESIRKYGHRVMVIGQNDVPFIDTYDEMWALLGVALNILKDIPATDGFTTQMMYHIEPNDLIETTNARLATGTHKVGITEVAHNFSPGGGAATRQLFTTTFKGFRDRIKGGLPYFPPGDRALPITLFGPAAYSEWHHDAHGNPYNSTTLTIITPPDMQVSRYEWRYAIEGENVWHTVITEEPRCIIMDLPLAQKMVWSVRGQLVGGPR